MAVPTPAIAWPHALTEEGPPEDAGILLTGEARIAGIAFNIMAVRMHPGLRTPDYRDDLDPGVYENIMDSMVDDIEDLVDSLEPELISLNAAQYLLWMVPAAHDEGADKTP
ncbi:MAG TPA: hypothetical protein VGM36_07535 [Rhizomicrobium sp.]